MPFARLHAFLAQHGGAAPFADFMAAALYDPEYGYYTRQIKTVGRGGDFSTSATLSPHLGQALAVWLGEDDRPLIEVGPGSGALAESLLQSIGWWPRQRRQLWLVEKSPVLKAQQQARLGKFRQVRWADSIEAALTACAGRAVIYSNELVDAFPVRLMEWRAKTWQEVWLEISPLGGLIETLHPFPEAISSVNLASSPHLRLGQRVEVAWSYRQWLGGWIPQAREVRLLTIDYGPAPSAAHSRRLGGSLRGYLHHERREGLALYENMGRQDLTADVCFADLIEWGEGLGLQTVAHESQASFLRRHLKDRQDSRILSHLLDEAGAGGAFRVLEQILVRS